MKALGAAEDAVKKFFRSVVKAFKSCFHPVTCGPNEPLLAEIKKNKRPSSPTGRRYQHKKRSYLDSQLADRGATLPYNPFDDDNRMGSPLQDLPISTNSRTDGRFGDENLLQGRNRMSAPGRMTRGGGALLF